MKIYRYVIDHDMGFAPNPFHGVCTLATCKPVIRRCASVGDFILGFGSASSSIPAKMIYWLRVGEKLTFDEYYERPEFQIKKPVTNGSNIVYVGDNIYRPDGFGRYLQSPSFHSNLDGTSNPLNIKRDTGSTNKVLVADHFGYFGSSAIDLPPEFSEVVPHGRGHRVALNNPLIQDVIANWLMTNCDVGVVGRPSSWM